LKTVPQELHFRDILCLHPQTNYRNPSERKRVKGAFKIDKAEWIIYPSDGELK
jgi:hypothetical protein